MIKTTIAIITIQYIISDTQLQTNKATVQLIISNNYDDYTY